MPPQRLSGGDAAAEEAIHLTPNVAFPHYALAYTLYHRDHLREAETAIEQALELAPWEADYYSLLASIRFDQRRWPAALEAAERGLELDAEHTGCVNVRAMALVKLGRRAEAGAALGDALSREPEDALTQANQGWTLLEQRQPDKALEHFREALRLDPNLEWARGDRRGTQGAALVVSPDAALLPVDAAAERRQWGVLIGLMIAQKVLASAVPPALAPLGTILFWCLIVFVLLTWTADPLFNLLLRLNRFGRLALSREQIRPSNWVGGCLFLAVVALIAWAVSGDGRFSLAALVSGCLVLPVAGEFKCPAGWPQFIMILFAILVAALGASGVDLLYRGIPAEEHLGRRSRGGQILLGMFFLGTIASTWLLNLLLLARSRR